MLKALFFDMDGVIVDTERDGHRVAFNKTFEDFGLPHSWDPELYHSLLQVAGGKERMRHFFKTIADPATLPPEHDDDEFIAKLHKHKTNRFIELLEAGSLPLRPGVLRFMQEAQERGLQLLICTTSNERAAGAIVNTMLSDIKFQTILAGDIVSKKKPDPEIYHLALERAGCSAAEALVIEDSHNGVLAAKAAGIPVLATYNQYTEQEDLSDAEIIADCLGEEHGPKATVRKPEAGLAADGVLRLEEVRSYIFAE